MAAEFTLTEKVLAKKFGGVGVQLNQHLFAKVAPFNVVPEAAIADLKHRLATLSPHLVRIFQSDLQEPVPFDPSLPPSAVNRRPDPAKAAELKDRWDSFTKVVELAESIGATTNITWAGGPHKTETEQKTSMARFANVLERLVKQGRTNVRWVTVANEPNRVKTITPKILAALYVKLDAELRQRNLREQIGFMAGDIVERPGGTPPSDPLQDTDPHSRFVIFGELSEHAALMDAYSDHIYWNYFDVGRFEKRLKNVQRIATHLSPRKPFYLTEFGIRGRDRRPNTIDDPGNFHEGGTKIPLRKSNVAAFQHAWFMIRAAQLGFHGMLKWDAYFAKYDKAAQAYYLLGRPEPPAPFTTWEPYPTYFALQMFTLTTEPGWSIAEVTPEASSGKHLAGFRGSPNDCTIIGLHQGGAQLNTPSTQAPVPYTITGLPKNKAMTLLLWNKKGGGRLRNEGPVTTNAQGLAALRIPLHSAFALTTKHVPALDP